MTLSNGLAYLAIPGPSVIPERVLRAMHRSSPNIYDGPLVDMTPGIVADLKALARTSGDVAIYIGNGHAAWEAAVSNVFSRRDKALALVTGRFAAQWAEVARRMGVEVEILDFGLSAPADPARLAERLTADTGQAIKAVLTVQVDTATSVRNDVAALRAAIDAAGHPALLMIDAIASFGCERFEMDAWGADVMVTACQKGLMTPPGLGFVAFNARADAARDSADCLTHDWDWRPRVSPEGFYQYFDGTAPTHHLYGLREALDMIAEEGLEAVWRRHQRLAAAVWAAVGAWGAEGQLAFQVPEAAARSHAVTTLRLPAPLGAELRTWVERNVGLTLGIGLGLGTPEDPRSAGAFRIGHMGHVNGQMMMAALGSIEAGLAALEVPRGRGALDAAARVIAEAAAPADQ